MFCDCTGRFVSDLVGIPNCWFSHAQAHISLRSLLSFTNHFQFHIKMDSSPMSWFDKQAFNAYYFRFGLLVRTLKKSYKRPPHIFSSSSESKIRSIKIHDHMNKPMSNSGSVSFCIPKCVILLTQTKHV